LVVRIPDATVGVLLILVRKDKAHVRLFPNVLAGGVNFFLVARREEPRFSCTPSFWSLRIFGIKK